MGLSGFDRGERIVVVPNAPGSAGWTYERPRGEFVRYEGEVAVVSLDDAAHARQEPEARKDLQAADVGAQDPDASEDQDPAARRRLRATRVVRMTPRPSSKRVIS